MSWATTQIYKNSIRKELHLRKVKDYFRGCEGTGNELYTREVLFHSKGIKSEGMKSPWVGECSPVQSSFRVKYL